MNKKGKFLMLTALLSLVLLNLPAWAKEAETPGLKTPVEQMELPKVTSEKKGFGIGLRLHGGMNFLQGGDINDTRSNVTLNEYFAGEAGLPFTIDENDLNRCLEGGVDLLFYLGRRFGVSLGAAYLTGKAENFLAVAIPTFPPDILTITFDPEIEAVPVNVGLFYILPLGNRFNLVAEAGAGYTFARLRIGQSFAASSGSQEFNAEGDAGGVGGFARLALEVKISRGLFFFIEALGRYAKISGFDGRFELLENGSVVHSGDGRFYTFDLNVSGHPIPFIDFIDEFPTGSEVSNARDTEIDFTGVSARAGIRIRF